jgi:hypothetical protein
MTTSVHRGAAGSQISALPGNLRATLALWAAVPSTVMTPAQHLGDFLRARRERITPEDVGLPRFGRRRVPGLRREELALLAA